MRQLLTLRMESKMSGKIYKQGDIGEWKEIHQPYELNYHKVAGVKWCSNEEQFQTFWDKIKKFIEPKGRVLDIGCGPRPPFKGTCIEPLGDEYKKISPKEWWEDIELICKPAEEFIPELEGQFDTVISWNCLDHTYNWREIIKNMRRYVKDDGIIAIATDMREPMLGHPSFKKEDFWSEINKMKIVHLKNNFQEREVALVLKK